MGEELQRFRVRAVYVPRDEALISIVSVTENGTGGAKTNEPFEFGFPIQALELGADEVLKVYDDDGAGGKGAALANWQFDNEASDGLAAANSVRFGKVTGILPNLASGGTRKLHVYRSADARPDGTPITLSDLAALAGYANGLCKVSIDIGGTTYTVSVKDIVDAAITTYSKTALWTSPDTWRSGPTCTEWILRGAPRNGGSSHASGDGLHVEFHVAAYKAGTAAVSGGNPITAVRVDVCVDNADITRSAGACANYHYGLLIERATSLSDATMISSDQTDAHLGTHRFSFPRTLPAAGITLSSSEIGTGQTITRDAGTWPLDILGQHIVNPSGAGKMNVTARTSGTVVTGYIYEAFTGTSYSSSDWSICGVGHQHNQSYRRRVHIGTKPTNIALWGSHTSAVTPTTRAGMDYVAATAKMLPPYSKTFAGVSHSMTALNLMVADGIVVPLSQNATNKMGDVELVIATTGGREDIGLNPGWAVYGLTKYDADGRRRIFENGDYYATWPYLLQSRLSGSPSAGALPVFPRADGGTQYYRVGGGSWMGTAATCVVSDSWQLWTNDVAHHASAFYIPYLLTGDYWWFKHLQRQGETSWFMTNSGYHGVGANKTPYGERNIDLAYLPWGDGQPRGRAWLMRDLLHAAIAAPEASKPSLAHAKSYWRGRVADTWQAALGWIDVKFSPGHTNPVHLGISSDGTGYHADSMSWSGIGNWQNYFGVTATAYAGRLGLTNADWTDWATWYARSITDAPFDANVVADTMTISYVWVGKRLSGAQFTAEPASWAEFYQRTALLQLNTTQTNDMARVPSGTVTLSDASVGTGRTVTFSSSYFTSGGTGTGAWFVGGYIREIRAGAHGVARITSVTSATVVEVEVVQEFSGTSLTPSNVRIPGWHPTDYAGERETITSDDYHISFVVAARLLKDAGISTTAAQAAIDYMTGRTGWSESVGFWEIAI